MESRTTINVAKLGESSLGGQTYQHYFDIDATDSRYGERRVNELIEAFREKFPSPEYSLSVTRWNITGEQTTVYYTCHNNPNRIGATMVYVLLETGQTSPIGVFKEAKTPYLIPQDATLVKDRTGCDNYSHREIVVEWTKDGTTYTLVAYVLQKN
jgi:hypothetical protein